LGVSGAGNGGCTDKPGSSLGLACSALAEDGLAVAGRNPILIGAFAAPGAGALVRLAGIFPLAFKLNTSSISILHNGGTAKRHFGALAPHSQR
jgi:hypothetical protein